MAHPDFEEFIAALNERGVRYLLIGAHAVAFHARPRATKDLDVFVEPSAPNARRLLDALADFFGGTPPHYSVRDVTDPDTVLQLGFAPIRIDVLSAVDGIRSFGGAWRRREEGRFGAVPTQYLSLEDLIRAKVAAAASVWPARAATSCQPDDERDRRRKSHRYSPFPSAVPDAFAVSQA
jgi:hypothetical protein